MKTSLLLVAAGLAVASFNASAVTITPADCTESILTGGNCTTGLDTPNLDAADISGYVGFSVEELYKSNVGGIDEGSFESNYDTEYFNTPTDPEDAEIVGSGIVSDSAFLLVKDGKSDPSWYLFDISGWDGSEVITLSDFWPAFDADENKVTGAISHVAIYGNVSAVPIPAAIWLFGAGLIGLFGVARRK